MIVNHFPAQLPAKNSWLLLVWSPGNGAIAITNITSNHFSGFLVFYLTAALAPMAGFFY
jgi:hypothetical protein